MKHLLFSLHVVFSSVLFFSGTLLKAQTPSPALCGYFHNWQDGTAPYIQLNQVDFRYNVIDIAFALPVSGTTYNIGFVPDQVSQATFVAQVQTLHGQGRKVLISIGGETGPVSLNSNTERDVFITSVNNIISTYHFDGIDIDFEGNSLSVSGGTINNPVDQTSINLIYAVKQIMANFYSLHSNKMILTMAPETAFVQGGMSAYGGIWGGYLPVIQALRDSIDVLHVQLYNSGSMYGIDGNIYTEGTADFIVAMVEAAIRGFNTAGGLFLGLPANKIAVGLPAAPGAAGGGFTSPAIVKLAVDYLLGNGPRPGAYTLSQSGGYPSLKGMMTWSINWDGSGGNNYSYASNYISIFATPVSTNFLSFSGQHVNNQNILRWETRALNNGYFSVMHSADGMNYEELGKVYAGVEQRYSFADVNPDAGVNYYFLRQVDPNNNSISSNIISININRKDIGVFPNPFKNSIHIDHPAPYSYLLLNDAGQVVAKGTDISANDFSLLPAGVYLLKVSGITQFEFKTFKLIKQ